MRESRRPRLPRAKSHLEEDFAMQVKFEQLPDPEREYRFHPARKWRFDFAWPDQKLAVEMEGGIWIAGRHNRPITFEEDCEKYAEATLLGWRVLRVTTKMVNDGSAIRWLRRALGMVRQ